jgi:hypothetical protein
VKPSLSRAITESDRKEHGKEEPGPPSGDPHVAYAERLGGLTAKGWLDLG